MLLRRGTYLVTCSETMPDMSDSQGWRVGRHSKWLKVWVLAGIHEIEPGNP